MPGFYLYTSNRLEKLIEKLGDTIAAISFSPLDKKVIIVQSKGMEKWISIQLAQRFGIWANTFFPFPNTFVEGLFKRLLPELSGSNQYHPEILTFRILRILPELLVKKEFKTIRQYFSSSNSSLKRYQLARRIADLFDQYLFFRPEMIFDWENNSSGHVNDITRKHEWQEILWKALVREDGKNHRAHLRKKFINKLKLGIPEEIKLPEHVFVFGLSVLPPYHLEILSALAEYTNIYFFLMNPCRELWSYISTERELLKRTKKKDNILPSQKLYLELGNRPLGALGQLGRDFFTLIQEYGFEEKTNFHLTELFINPLEVPEPGEPCKDSLLAVIQSDVLNLIERNANNRLTLKADDNSVHFHCCHSRRREIDVLKDHVIDFLEKYDDIHPEDILVMAPEIEHYIPFIKAIFGNSLPYSISDRKAVAESPLIEAFLSLLSIPHSRFKVLHILKILESEMVKEKLNLSDEGLEKIKLWIRQTNIRWGMDEEERALLGLHPYKENTWRAGLDRLILGFAMSSGQLFQDILPYSQMESGHYEWLDCFSLFLEKLFSFSRVCREFHCLKKWGAILIDVLQDLFQPKTENYREYELVENTIMRLIDIQKDSGFNETVDVLLITSWLKESLSDKILKPGFMSRGMTFCSMLPMRSVPFKVICLLGMNDKEFPRTAIPCSFDLMAGDYRLGDRLRQNDDRYLFLETILSARKILYLSYVGQNIQDNSPIPPSVLVSELLDMIDEGFSVKGPLVRKHKLQPFNPDYFVQNQSNAFFSYTEENCKAAKALLEEGKSILPFIENKLTAPDQSYKHLDISILIGFFHHPVKFFCRTRLGLYLDVPAMEMEEREPFKLEGLDAYFIKQELLEVALQKRPLEDLYPIYKGKGSLPHGKQGEIAFQTVCSEVRAFSQKVNSVINDNAKVTVDIDFQLGEYRITGQVELYNNQYIQFRMANIKPKDRLSCWLIHLILCHSRGETTSILIGRDKQFSYRPVNHAEEILKKYLNLYWEGLRGYTYFFPSSSFCLAEKLGSFNASGDEQYNNETRGKALKAAIKKWEGNPDRGDGEKNDHYYSLCFKNENPLTIQFERTSLEILKPLLLFEEALPLFT
jgi:exodeoxyribonuclease V gamma subunit